MSHLILVGGLPGSGKSTLAQILHEGLHAEYRTPMIVSADDFFCVTADEEVCGSYMRKDANSLRGADYARYRVARSVSRSVEPPWTYRFDPGLIVHAHYWCQEQVRNVMAARRNIRGADAAAIVVHNTFTRRWEMEPYLELARGFGARVTVTRLFDGGCSDEELAARNSHGVPLDVIQRMRLNWEEDWGRGDPTHPSLRPASNP